MPTTDQPEERECPCPAYLSDRGLHLRACKLEDKSVLPLTDIEAIQMLVSCRVPRGTSEAMVGAARKEIGPVPMMVRGATVGGWGG